MGIRKDAGMYKVVKRVLDILFAVILLVLLLPLMTVVAGLVKIDSPGPVLFRQRRVGRGGKVFEIWKFRSMVVGNDVRDGSRANQCTRVGRVIRRLSIDELPQLFNVLVGQMSFVGPRPWIEEYWENMNERERGRAAVRPGITGLAQVMGRNGLTVFQKIEYDLLYVEKFSLWQDVKVMGRTVVRVMTGKGADAAKEGVLDDIAELAESRRASLR